jgi:hypothetical protein
MAVRKGLMAQGGRPVVSQHTVRRTRSADPWGARKYGTMAAWDRMSTRQARAVYNKFGNLYDTKPSAWQPGDHGPIDRAMTASYDANVRHLRRLQSPAVKRVYRAGIMGKSLASRDRKILAMDTGKTGEYIEVWDRKDSADWIYKQGIKERGRRASKVKWNRRKTKVRSVIHHPLRAIKPAFGGFRGYDANKHPRYPKGSGRMAGKFRKK